MPRKFHGKLHGFHAHTRNNVENQIPRLKFKVHAKNSTDVSNIGCSIDDDGNVHVGLQECFGHPLQGLLSQFKSLVNMFQSHSIEDLFHSRPE